jgi:hypothetical protein
LDTDSLIAFTHKDNIPLDFDREPLIAFAGSSKGPDISIGDTNGDGLQDLFISGAKRQASALFIQKDDRSFTQAGEAAFMPDALNEDTGHILFDADGDGWLDLLVVSGGNEFTEGEALRPRLYRNKGGDFKRDDAAFQNIYLNASHVDTLDLDADGDTDVFISSDAVPGAFGARPQHGLFENDGSGRFREVTAERFPEIQQFGSIQDFVWTDLNGDHRPDLVAAGHWNPIAVFLSEGGGWKRIKDNDLDTSQGLWNCVKAVDIDLDGDLDLIGGNWGLNTKFRASMETPITLYRYDFDQNGSVEPVVTYYHMGAETPFASRDELGKQMPFLNKKFRTYREFASASMEALFGEEALQKAERHQVHELASCVFLNQGNGQFQKVPLPTIGQASVIYDFLPDDLNGDGLPDLLVIGNLYEISTQLGRLDAFHGLVLRNEGDGSFAWDRNLTLPLSGAGRSIDTIRIQEEKLYAIGRNNASPVFISKNEK